MAQPVGLIGIGLMGSALAHRLLGAGFQVVGFDVDEAKRAALTRLGGRQAGSVGEVARLCGRIFLAVFSTDQVEAVVEGADGIAAGRADAPSPTIVLCTATCEPDRIAALAVRAAARGVAFLDTPVSGTSQQVRDGDGLGLIAGDRAAAERARDAIEAVYPRHRFIGPAGDASKAKLAINLILGLNRLALAEGLVFAERLGLDTQAFLDVAKASAAHSQIMDVKGAKMLSGDFAPQGKIAQSHKDFQIMLAEATSRGQDLPLARTYLDVLAGCLKNGQADWDNASVIEEVRRRKV